MTEEKKPNPTAADTQNTAAAEAKAEQNPEQEQPEQVQKTPQEQAKAENTPPAETPEKAAEPEAALPELSELDKLKEENFRLKAQLEANTIGFLPDVQSDAVTLAESIAKREGGDISAALKAVAKKYPGWLASAQDEKQKGGFKLGADSSNGGTSDTDEKLDQIFGIRKKK